MNRRVLIAGSSGVLAVHLAAKCVSDGNDVLLMPADPRVWGERDVLDLLDGDEPGQVRAADLAEVGALPTDEIWCLAAGADPAQRRGQRVDGDTVHLLTGLLPRLGADTFFHVGPADEQTTAAYREFDAVAERRCAQADVTYRRIWTGNVAAPSSARVSARDGGLCQLVSALLSVRDEVAERHPGYWHQHPLRMVGEASSVLGATPAADAVRLLLDARRIDQPFAPAATGFAIADIAEVLVAETGVTLHMVSDAGSLSQVDRLFACRLGVLVTVAEPATGADNQAITAVVRATAGSTARRQPAGGPEPGFVKSVSLTTGRGPITYLTSGNSGVPLVILNAFGVGPRFWYRLMERLLPRRVLLWQGRMVDADRGHAPTLDEHIADLIEVFDDAQVAQCHLAAWCSGATIAMELPALRPDLVASLTLLNGSLKRPSDGDEMDTPFQRGVAAMCQAVRRRPELARVLARSFSRPAEDVELDVAELTGRAVLASADPLLRQEIRQSLQDPESLGFEIERLLHFASIDPLRHADRIVVPILCVAGEYDDVVSSASIKRTASALPSARYVELVGATHFLMHDRAEAIAELLETFMADASRLGEATAEAVVIQ